MKIVRAGPEHALALTQIALAAKRHWGYPERWIEMWTPQLTITPEFISTADVWIAATDDEIAGFFALAYSDQRALLEHLWILPKHMNRGVGRRLFEHAVSRCREAGCTALEVESDPNAQGFYERMGAHKVRERKAEVEGRPRALPIMELKL